jgi:HK97 family phage major capsid protein
MKTTHMGGLMAVAALSCAHAAALPGMTAHERRLGRFLRDAEGHRPAGDGARELSPEQIADELRKSIDQKHGDVMKKADAALDEAKKAGGLSAETKNAVDQALTGINTLREQLAQIEQKMARRPGQDENAVKSFGEQLVGSDKFKAFQANGYQGNVRVPFQAKAITAANAGSAWPDIDREIVELPRRQFTVRSLLTVVPTTSGTIEYARQTTRTNAAAAVAEAATKPYSNYVWEQVSTAVRTIAHMAKITRQALDDAVQLQGEVESEMRYGLSFAEEDEILNGDGTGQHLDGLIANATAFAAPITIASPTMIDNLRLAFLQAELALYPSDGVVLNPADWANIELTKDSQDRYIWANPAGLLGPRIWAKPVVTTPAMTIDKFLAGGFKLQTLYDRLAPEVLISSENVDDFEKNLYSMRCEERLALGVKRPAALIYGDFGNVP